MTRGSPLGRALWAMLRAAERPLTVRELWLGCGAPSAGTAIVSRRLTGWRRAGFVAVERVEGLNIEGRREWRGWRLRPDAPVLPPPVGRGGRVHDSTSAQERLWKAIRVLRTFDLPILCASAQAARQTARRFVQRIEAAGYVRRVSQPYLEEPRWRLVRNSGPAAPVLGFVVEGGRRADTVRDGNTGQTFVAEARRCAA